MDAGAVILGVLALAGLVWYFYMLTCKPDQFVKLMKAHREHYDAQDKRIGKATKGALGVASFVAKRFLKR